MNFAHSDRNNTVILLYVYHRTPSHVVTHETSLEENTSSPSQVHNTSIMNRSGISEKKKPKAKYIINIDKVLAGVEKRHTVMLKNIPNR